MTMTTQILTEAVKSDDIGAVLDLISEGKIRSLHDLDESLLSESSSGAEIGKLMKILNGIAARNKLIPLGPRTIHRKLLDAVINRDQDEVYDLISKGADPNKELEDGVSPLHFAVINQMYLVIKYLLEAGADPNMKSPAGSTPFHYMFSRGKTWDHSLIKMFLDHGASFTIPDGNGQSVADMCYDDPDTREMLIEFMETISDPTKGDIIDL